MRASTKAYIESLSTKVNRNNKRAESSYVFRKILNAALEDEIWAELGTEGVFKLHRVKLEACKSNYMFYLFFQEIGEKGLITFLMNLNKGNLGY